MKTPGTFDWAEEQNVDHDVRRPDGAIMIHDERLVSYLQRGCWKFARFTAADVHATNWEIVES